jgi:hypothetical protein
MLDRGYDGGRDRPLHDLFCIKRCNHRYLFGSGARWQSDPRLRV